MPLPPTGSDRRVGLYREPARTAFMVALLVLLVAGVVDLIRGTPDRYRHEHAMLVLLPLALILGHFSAGYAPPRWQRWTAPAALAFALGLLLAQLVA
jgi:hypothetical protein